MRAPSPATARAPSSALLRWWACARRGKQAQNSRGLDACPWWRQQCPGARTSVTTGARLISNMCGAHASLEG
ncbi:hypothetical protein JKP88DRAFT_348654, partial [Tribonema minus]